MYTYIIVDDESLIRKGTRKKLEPITEIECIGEASNGEEALVLVDEKKPDLAIIDMQMPSMDGMKLLPLLHEKHADLKLIVISGFRDFDYIKQAIASGAIDYILKPFSKEAIQNCVRKAIDQIESNQAMTQKIEVTTEEKEHAYYEYDIQYLTNLILGYHSGTSSISSRRLKFINETHHLILMTLYHGKRDIESFIREWMDQGNLFDLALYLTDKTTPHLSFLICFMPQRNLVNSDRLISQITNDLLQIAHEQQIPLQIGVSLPHDNVQELHQAFRETSVALNTQLLNRTAPSVYLYKEETPPQTLVWNKEDEFLFRLEAGMQKEVNQLTDELFDYMSSQKNFTLNDAKYYCFTLYTECHRIMTYYLKQENSSSSSMQNIVSHIFHLEDLKDYYRQFFLNMAELLKTESVYNLDDVIEKIQVYIQFNYQKDLTQDYVASLFYMNRSYLSTLFKKTTGTKFIDYLNDIRIQHAMEYLKNSDRKMYQIAKTVGYENTKYFFRIFKKRTGMTPEQYREQYNK